VSRRSRRAAGGERAGGGAPAGSGASAGRGAAAPHPVDGDRAPGRPPNRISFAAQVALLVVVFAAGVGVAELFGATDLGTAFGIGQICFAIVLVALLLRA
jgi:hypothetical protein